MASLLQEHPSFQGVDGKPLVGGKVFIGTQNQDPTAGYPDAPVNLITIYAERALTTPIENPQTIDSYGRSTNKIWIPEEYSMVVWDANDVQTYINLDVGGSLRTDLALSSGSSLVGFLPAGTGAVATTVQSKLRESVSVQDFGAVGDGVTDDTAAIQAAWDDGRTVIHPFGDYVFTQLTIPSNRTLIGEEGATLRPTTVDTNWIINDDVSGGNTNITIRGLRIDGSSVTAATVDSAAIKLTNVTNLTIQYCVITNVPVSAIICQDITNFDISYNRIITTGTAGYLAAPPVETGGGIISSDMIDGVISSNNISDCWAVCIYLDATSSGGETRSVAINGNVVNGSADNGIRVNGIRPDNLTDVSRISIVGNTIVDIDGTGIRATGSYLTVTGNNISLRALTVSDADPTHAPSGIDIEGIHIVVDSNVIYDATGIMTGGIRMTFNADTIHNITISNNIIDAIGGVNGYGIIGTLGTGTTFRDITIEGNQITNTATQEGMFFDNVEDLNIINNRINNSFQEGLFCDTCSNVTISLNKFRNNNLENSSAIRGGIRLITCDGVIISNNRAYDDQGTKTQKYGVYLDGGAGLQCDEVIVENNDFRGNATDGVGIGFFTTNLKVKNNAGYVTENNGTATLLSSNTSVNVTHGLSDVPTVININWRENPTNLIADWWIDNIGGTTFRLNGVDPGASNLDFGWEAKVR